MLDLGPYTAPTQQGPAVPAHVFTQPIPSLPLLLPRTTHQCSAAVTVAQSDRHSRSAEARHGDLPPLQPPDQSLDRTGLAPPPFKQLDQPNPGQGNQGSTGVRRLVVVPSPSCPSTFFPQHLSVPVSCSPPLFQSLHFIESPLPHPSALPHFTWTNACL